MQVKSTAESFCNTFDLHSAIIGLENLLFWSFLSGRLRQVCLYCRILQGEHSVIRLTFIKLPVVIKMFDLSIFEGPLYTGFTVM